MCISRKVKKSESKSQQTKQNQSIKEGCVYPVKLKNLKANHNQLPLRLLGLSVVYIRKVKKSESKSQPPLSSSPPAPVVYIRKVKKSESKSQPTPFALARSFRCVYP